jgi:hypothetical protein
LGAPCISINKVFFILFSRTHLSVYFIKKVAVTDKQAREHLAQTQRKS